MWNKTAFFQLCRYKLCLPGLKVVLRTKELQQMPEAPSFELYSFIRPGSMCCLFLNIHIQIERSSSENSQAVKCPNLYFRFSFRFTVYVCWQSRHVLREIALAQFEKFHFILCRRLGRSPDLNRFQGLAINTEGVERNVTAIWQTKKYLYACFFKKTLSLPAKVGVVEHGIGVCDGVSGGWEEGYFCITYRMM